MKRIAGFFLGLLLLPFVGRGADAQTDQLRARAYELAEQKRYEQAADFFQRYLEKNPADTQASVDYAGLLSQLNRHAQAAQLLESVHQKVPRNEAAYFKLGAEYALLKRTADAEKVFSELERSGNRDIASAAAAAHQRLRADVAREARFKAEEKVYELGGQFKHEDVLREIAALEQQAPLSFPLQMQRLYARHSLHRYAEALEKANQLAVAYPSAPDLALVRADLLAQWGRPIEAKVIWRQVERENAGTAAATEASQRLQAQARTETEQHVYELARQQKHREVISAVDELKRTGPVPLDLEIQRLYALQHLREYKLALKRAEELSAAYPKDPELALVLADLLAATGDWKTAEPLLERIAREYAGTKPAFVAQERLEAEQARRTRNRAEENIFTLARP